MLAPALWIITSAGCAGNGQGLDQNGQPISAGGGGAGGPITADFDSIQDNVFTPICSKCHIGASAPEGLQLDAAHSYNLLVGVPSNEQPSLDRVKPGDPDDSYMVHKIEGLSGIDGGRMPLGESPLPQATIAAIRQWITNGAAKSTSGTSGSGVSGSSSSATNMSVPATSATQSFAVETTAPVAGATVEAPINRVVVTFTQDLDASMVNDTTVSMERMDADGDDTTTARRLKIAAAPSRTNAAVIVITPETTLAPGDYRVSLRGTGGAGISSLRGQPLAADLTFHFIVESAP